MAEHFAIVRGHNQTSIPNVQTMVTDAPHVLDADEATYTGPVKRVVASRHVQRNGAPKTAWHWNYMTQADFNALMIYLFLDFTTSYADVTIITLDETGHYARFNAVAHKPHPKDDYSNYGNGKHKKDVTLPLDGLVSTGEFTFEFSDEFTR